MNERTKLVVRHLPPTLPEEIFWKTLDPWLQPTSLSDGTVLPPKCTATFKSYVPGKVRRNKSKIDVPSRAYIQLLTSDQVVEFHQGYINQAFRDSHGHLTFPKVEFAPYQKVAGPPKKMDSRIGTIEADRDYQAFLATLDAPPPPSNTEPSHPDPGEKVDPPQITPLLEHLRSLRKAEQDLPLSVKQTKHSSTVAHSSGQFKRIITNNSTHLSSGSISQKPSNSSLKNHDEPPHIHIISSKESKRTKHSSTNPLPSPNLQNTSSTHTNTSNNPPIKSRPIKSPKPKKNVRVGEDLTARDETKVKNSINASTQQPKKILQPPKPINSGTSVENSAKLNSNKNQDLIKSLPTNKNRGNSSNKKGEESEHHSNSHESQHHHQHHGNEVSKPLESESPKKSSGRGGVRGKGRGGRGEKSVLSNHKSIHSSSKQEPHETTSTPISTRNHPKTQEQTKKYESNQKETAAAARRSLGMALAGITSKTDNSNPSSSKKDTSSNS